VLIELRVADLGVIVEATLRFSGGMTALTGETGAGKTMIVGAIELLMGGRADAAMVRSGAEEAVVDGRFELDGEEVVLTRVVPRTGRSRAYLDGRPVTRAALAEVGERLVDLHGQHDHQSLLATAVQREALDRFGGIDLGPIRTARARVDDIDRQLAGLGGDERARARELDLVRFQLAELDDVAVTDADEDDRLHAEELLLGDALGHQEAIAAAMAALHDDGGAADLVAGAAAVLDHRPAFEALRGRLADLRAELDDVVAELRAAGDAIEHDPDRLALVQERRRLLSDVRRKYGATLSEVLAFHSEVADRVAELEAHDATAARLDAERAAALVELRAAEATLGAARRAAAPHLGEAVAAHLDALAMGRARLEVAVGEVDPGDDVAFLLAANPGAELQPLRKVASGGELARTMLALRLVLTQAPPTLVFDEVDAGIGGEAARAVGRALAELSGAHQVLVVTHLPQVAAAASQQVAVRKDVVGDATVSTVVPLSDAERVEELGRMLSGNADSEASRAHARELLDDLSGFARAPSGRATVPRSVPG